MGRFIEPAVLTGKHVQLEPLTLQHEQGLREAAADGALWKLWYCSVPEPEKTRAYIEQALTLQETVHEMPFAVREIREGQPGAVVGSTRFFRVDPANRHLEIGFTWYAKRVQGTLVNTEAKYLLLAHAFEQLECIAVEFRTHWMNHRSRAAIASLGAKQDGVLRNHVLMNGTRRDTVVFSIIDAEWPTVKQHLGFKLAGIG